jgi:hypothetical protein
MADAVVAVVAVAVVGVVRFEAAHLRPSSELGWQQEELRSAGDFDWELSAKPDLQGGGKI